MDFQGMLGDLPRNAWHIRGFPRKDVFVVIEEVDERAFLFEGKRRSNAHHFVFGGPGVYEDFLRAFHWLEGPDRPFGVGCFFGDLFFDVCKLSRGYDHCGVIAALDFALVGALKGCADGDDHV